MAIDRDNSTPANEEAPRVSNEKQGFNQVEKTDQDSSTHEQEQLEDDPVEAKRITRKIDWRLIPLLMMLYTLAFLDRVNIGNARLWNLEEDLGMEGYDYNIAILGMPRILDERSSYCDCT